MYENHKNEQYFFTEKTNNLLSNFIIKNFLNPCCLCTPSLGRKLVENKIKTRIFDIDERFANLNGFRYYDIYKPVYIGEKFDVIICDPPFFKVSLSQLFNVIRILSNYDFNQNLLITYLKRRSSNIIGTFSKFNLKPTNVMAEYITVQNCQRNDIEFFSNIDDKILNKFMS
jgi:hypothetical protein